jgi:hypothetical protein
MPRRGKGRNGGNNNNNKQSSEKKNQSGKKSSEKSDKSWKFHLGTANVEIGREDGWLHRC